MGCFSFQQGRRKSKDRPPSPSAPPSLLHPSPKALEEFKLSPFLFRSSQNSSTHNTSNNRRSAGKSTHYGILHHGRPSPYSRARAALHNASFKLVHNCPRALSARSSSSSKAREHFTQTGAENGNGHGGGRSIISYSAPMAAKSMEDEEGTFDTLLFPLPLPQTMLSVNSTSEDTSLQSASLGSGSSSSSSSTVPSAACSVSSVTQTFKSYDDPLGPQSPQQVHFNIEQKDSFPQRSLAQPLPLPPTFDFGMALREFSYDELAGACLNFAPEFCIRDGDAGPVFKATVREMSPEGGAVDFAVTRLSRWHVHSYKKWRAEVGSLARLSHPNICKVLGFSKEDPSSSTVEKTVGAQRERLLVYEHTLNGSLECLLYGRRGKAPLDWATRVKIALGAAQGLAFLHDRLPRQIIYKCFRTSNIQVDINFNAKLSDYGFARSSAKGLSTCNPARTLPLDEPYVAPETLNSDEVTAKSNVWSFGVVLLELLTGRQNMDHLFAPEERDLLKWCRPHLLDPKRLYLVMDPELKGRYPTRKAKMISDLALQCLMEDPESRPSMRGVATSLSSCILTGTKADPTANPASASINDIHGKGGNRCSGSIVKAMYSKSYNLASVLASPGRSFPPRYLSHDPFCSSPASISKTRFRGFLSGEITKEASRSLTGLGVEHPFLSRLGFLSGETVVHAEDEPLRFFCPKGDFSSPKITRS